MPDLSFVVESVEPAPFAATPLLVFKLRVENRVTDDIIHSLVLRAQIMIEAAQRQYAPDEQLPLRDLFGEPDRWRQTVRSLLWTHANVVVSRFTGGTLADLPVPCTFDFNVAATKYFYGLTSGDLPLCFQFSGSAFYTHEQAPLQVAPIAWDKESKFRLPIRVWQEMMNTYYPNCAWLALRRDTFDKLYRFKVNEGIPTWEQTIERALSAVSESESVRS